MKLREALNQNAVLGNAIASLEKTKVILRRFLDMHTEPEEKVGEFMNEEALAPNEVFAVLQQIDSLILSLIHAKTNDNDTYDEDDLEKNTSYTVK